MEYVKKSISRPGTKSATQPGLHFRWQLSVLFLGDLIVSLASLFISLYYWYSSIEDRWFIEIVKFWPDFFHYRHGVQIWFYLFPLAWMALLSPLYNVERATNWQKTTRHVIIITLVIGIAFLFTYWTANNPEHINRRVGVLFLILTPILTLAWRWIYLRISDLRKK